MIYFTSDFHLGHKNVILYDNRPYKDLQDMEDSLVTTWNNTVKPTDTVYQLGDFFWGFNTALRVAPHLNGKIFCIKGNHDKSWWKPERVKREIPNLTLLTDQIHIVKDTGGHPPIIICHYPMRSWPGSARGSWHLYGHTHKKIEEHGLSLCVCINVCDYNLVSLEEVSETLKVRKKSNY